MKKTAVLQRVFRTPKSLVLAVLLGGLAWHPVVMANDLTILAERSKGLSLTGDNNKVAPSERLTLAAKGRVWAVKQQGDSAYNLICINQTNQSLMLNYNATEQPWLTDSNGTCSVNNDSVYSCSNDTQQTTLMCRSQLIVNNNTGGGITDMTAVALRSLDNSDDAFYRIANSVMEQHKLHFDLCEDMHGAHAQGGVSFIIQPSGQIDNVAVIKQGELATPMVTDDYAQCMAQAIELWRFPTLDYIYEMEYAFVN
ncbi:hypothetical protein [Planctobacterium marinum]|uniref:hypothetical protein n=1 Tax=Planctobacterium marinum TaxID=1631968 RepID=UPI001E3149F2|nr:hypothetical protein [Planctobacterium marinum]MCC2607872.1 hypothetical protein [Planctobacterium marinum]